jgi:branched-subunit amino acid aminotransferase/4-amino-4-deoxychorismate lyase
MAPITPYQQELNGQPIQLTDLSITAALNSGHFTAMQCRNGKIKGKRLHLRRLSSSSMLLFGCSVDDDSILGYIRHMIFPGESCSLRVHVFSTAAYPGNIRPADLQVLVIKTKPAELQAPPVSAGTAVFERFLPQVKHAGIATGLMYYKRRIQQAGFDDVLYTTASGEVSEGSIWNIGFFDGYSFVFPAAPALNGIMLQLITGGLERLDVPFQIKPIHKSALHQYKFAFLMNSIATAHPICRIDDFYFETDNDALALLKKAYAQWPWEEAG